MHKHAFSRKNTFHPRRRKETKNGSVKAAPIHREASKSNHKKI
jgi:hypothetical protein